MEEGSEMKLGPDDLNTVLTEIIDAKIKAYYLGLQLGLTPATVEGIRQQYGDLQDRLLQVLIEYLKKIDPHPTWRAIADALRSATVDLPYLAERIENKYSFITTPQPSGQDKHGAPAGFITIPVPRAILSTERTYTYKQKQEIRENTLLQELKRMKGVEGRKPTPPTGEQFVDSRGIKYDMMRGGIGGNTYEVMMVVSVGSQYPAGISVQPRVRDPALAERAIQTHGHLPSTVTGLHEEAAADLMARTSLVLQDYSADLVRLCLDIPGKQRPKQYYLNTIEEFFKLCKQPSTNLGYLGHSEKGTGNWCFKDGTISFQEIFALYRKHCPGKVINIMTDCCYSGQWTIDCAKTLDSLGIPLCGHRARDHGILITVFASCQPDQKAAEPCYSVEGVTMADNATVVGWNKKLAQQTSTWCMGTQLTCCRGPNESCCSGEALKNWTWQEALNGRLSKGVQIARLSDQGRPTWHYLLLSNKSEEYKRRVGELVKSGSINLTEWGYVIASGEGRDPPQEIRHKLFNWMYV